MVGASCTVFSPMPCCALFPREWLMKLIFFFISLYQKVEQRPYRPCYIPAARWSMNLSPSLFIFFFSIEKKRGKERGNEKRRETEAEGERERTSLDHFSKRSTSTGTSVLAALYRAAYKWWITNIDRTREGDKTSDEHRVWVNQGEKVGGRGRRTTEGWGKEGGGERDGGRRDREVVTPKGEAGKLFASRQAQKANLRMRCAGAATPMRPVGPSLDFDQV